MDAGSKCKMTLNETNWTKLMVSPYLSPSLHVPGQSSPLSSRRTASAVDRCISLPLLWRSLSGHSAESPTETFLSCAGLLAPRPRDAGSPEAALSARTPSALARLLAECSQAEAESRASAERCKTRHGVLVLQQPDPDLAEIRTFRCG